MIPQNQRNNFERTSDLLHETRVLLTALELADDNAPDRNNLDQYAQAVPALIRMLELKLIEVEKGHFLEWIGIGGNSNDLTDDEIKLARGE
ncbi:hypothetical protein [Thalassovita taeanensis]|uniref:Uncharacterized protein n=1 Tax=Thalassovita taeanensis TaxID=657014 RepID=A0A1H8ZCG8_9RHOB|nr:hypothetical protein [Thalassovita taeanensis]SEP62092.1 hypothetical protein SAMN04488092_101390 [Thalassovita taeanensis]